MFYVAKSVCVEKVEWGRDLWQDMKLKDQYAMRNNTKDFDLYSASNQSYERDHLWSLHENKDNWE